MAVQAVLSEVVTQAQTLLGDVNIDTFTKARLLPWINEAYRYVQKLLAAAGLDAPKQLITQHIAPGQTSLTRGAVAATTGLWGSGLSDITWTLTPAAPTVPRLYWVRIRTAGTPDKVDAGYDNTVVLSNVSVSGAAQTIDATYTFTLAATTGHTAGNIFYKAFNSLPVDLIRPIEMYERQFPANASATAWDTTTEFVPMGRVQDGVLPIAQTTSLKMFQWENDIVKLAGATAIVETKLKYHRGFADLSGDSDPVLVPVGIDALALLTASYASLTLGQEAVATAFEQRARAHLQPLLDAEMKFRSAMTARIGGQ